MKIAALPTARFVRKLRLNGTNLCVHVFGSYFILVIKRGQRKSRVNLVIFRLDTVSTKVAKKTDFENKFLSKIIEIVK